MFDIAPTELLLCAVVALLVIGPKDLPRALRVLGQWVGRARGVARHFRSGLDTMIREAELQEMERRWKEENERIMREHPAPAASETPALAAPAAADGESAPVLTQSPLAEDGPETGHSRSLGQVGGTLTQLAEVERAETTTAPVAAPSVPPPLPPDPPIDIAPGPIPPAPIPPASAAGGRS